MLISPVIAKKCESTLAPQLRKAGVNKQKIEEMALRNLIKKSNRKSCDEYIDCRNAIIGHFQVFQYFREIQANISVTNFWEMSRPNLNRLIDDTGCRMMTSPCN